MTVLVLVVGLAYGLGGYPLLEPDEGRNAEVAREMAESNDYILPHLNGLPYLDKPVVSFAAGAVVMEVAGPSVIAARIPALVFTVLTGLLVAWFGAHLLGPAASWTAVVAYAASPFTIAYARTVIFDSALTFWLVAALAAFYCAVEGSSGEIANGRNAEAASVPSPTIPSWGWSLLGWAAVALGVLTKGPVAVAVPLLVMLPYALWRRAGRAIADPVGLLVFVAIVLPWILLVQRRVPDFLQYVLIVETAQRVATDALGRSEPVWYFFPILIGAALPWTIGVLAGIRRRMDHRAVFLFLWIVVPLVFFSLSQSKRPQYILPLVPALALLLGHYWSDHRAAVRGAIVSGAFLVAAGLGLLAGRQAIAGLFDPTDAVANAIPGTATGLGIAAVFAGILTIVVRQRRDVALLALAVPAAAIPMIAMPLMRAIGDDRSSAALAEIIREATASETEIVAVHYYPLSLAFYLQRPLTLATRDASELTSNYIERHSEVLRRLPRSPLRPPEWWREAATLCSQPRVFVARRSDAAVRAELAAHLPLLAETGRSAAYGPCGIADLARGGT